MLNFRFCFNRYLYAKEFPVSVAPDQFSGVKSYVGIKDFYMGK